MHKRWYFDFRRPYSIPALLFLAYLALDILAGVAGVRMWFFASAQTPPAPPASAPNVQPQDVAARITDLEKRLDAAEKRLASTPTANDLENRAGDLEKLLGALATVGTIFGLAVGLSTYFNLKDIQAKAEKDLGELRTNAGTEMTELRQHAEKEMDEIRADFPALARLNRKLARMLEELRSYGNLRLEELDEQSYSRFSPEQREEILVREMAFSATVLFDYGKVEALQGSAAEAFVTFGHFYGARYMSDQQAHAAAFQRAMIYLESALENGKDEVATRVRSALGVLCIWESERESDPAKKAELRQLAAGHLNAVLAKNELDPRCLLAAAWVDKRDGRMTLAIERLDKIVKAADEKKLTERQIERFLGRAYMNRACYRALSKGDAEQAMKDLRASRGIANQNKDAKKWIVDLKASAADLTSLRASFGAELKEMEDEAYAPSA